MAPDVLAPTPARTPAIKPSLLPVATMTDAAGESTDGQVERLHSRIRLVWAGGAVLLGLLVAAAGWLVLRFVPVLLSWLGPAELVVLAVAAAVGVLGLLHAFARYRVWRFELQEDALYLERGVITRVETAVPYVRVQHIDTQRGPVDRLAGLSSVVVYTAGSRGADVTVPGLAPDRARRLRDRLRELAVEAEPGDAV